MILRYGDRELELDLSFGDGPDDTTIEAGVDITTGAKLSDDELDEITANTDFYDEWRDRKIEQAEIWAEMDR